VRISFLVASSTLALVAMPAAAQQQPATTGAEERVDDDFHTTSEDLVVTAPYVRSLDLLGNVTVVTGDELARDMRTQVGDTLARQPGVSATSFTPGASRPVLRGFQGERVRVLVDGIGSIDASNTSADHAVAFDSLTAERVEILRGPASLLFGSNAAGGAVNIFDRRIPRSVPDEPVHIDALATYGSAADERALAGSVDIPVTRNLVLHADAAWSRTDDMRIGGFQVAPLFRDYLLEEAEEERDEGEFEEAEELEEAALNRGSIPNSATETLSAAGGIAWITPGGNLGVSISYYDTDYGIPARPGAGHHHGHGHGHGHGGGMAAGAEEENEDVTIGVKQWRADVRGEVQLGGGFLETLRIRAGFADYEHIEFEGDEVGTRFFNQGVEARAELVQRDRNGWRGASGVQYSFRDFNAIGAEAFVPQNDTEQFGIFTLQELRSGSFDIEAAARFERTNVQSNAIGISRDFSAFSGALGFAYNFSENSKVGVNLARTSRAPAAEELFSDGPHIATQAYEIGDPDFGLEKSWSVEGYAKLRFGAASLNIAAYANWFDGFIFDTPTGAEEDELPVFQYFQRDARFYGAEVELTAPLMQFGSYTLSGDVVADVVRAELSGNGGDLPRIPPLRLRGGLELASDVASLRGEVEWAEDQTRNAAFERPTDGYTLVNLSASWKPLGADGGVTLILSGNNLLDTVARRHASFTKDFVPLAGRDIRATVRLSF
jgi:iron complex outermembrane recepter protein